MPFLSALEEREFLHNRLVLAPTGLKQPLSYLSSSFLERLTDQVMGKLLQFGYKFKIKESEWGPDIEFKIVERAPPNQPVSKSTAIITLKSDVAKILEKPQLLDPALCEKIQVIRRFFDSNLYANYSTSILAFKQSYYDTAELQWLSEKLALMLSDAELAGAVKLSPYLSGALERRFFRGRYYRTVGNSLEKHGDWDQIKVDVENALTKYGKVAGDVLIAALQLSQQKGKFTFTELVSALANRGTMYWPSAMLNFLEFQYRLIMTVYHSRRYREWFVPPETWEPIGECTLNKYR